MRKLIHWIAERRVDGPSMSIRAAWFLALFVCFHIGGAAAQHVLSGVRDPLSPQLSDVVFSTRFLRPESSDVARSFSATRAEWIYVPNGNDDVGQFRQLPAWIGLTLNANPTLPNGQGYALDFDGTPLVAPWMKSWGAKWVTTTHPETRQALDRQLERSLAVGAKSIQFDDPLLQVYSARSQGGEFNPATQAGFIEWLHHHPDQAAVRSAGLGNLSESYRDFLIQKYQVRDASDYKRRIQSFASTNLWQRYIQSTVEEYFSSLRDRLHGRKPNAVALSMNVSIPWPDAKHPSFFLTAFPDYLIAEADIIDTSSLIAQVATARALRLGFTPSIRPIDLARNRVAIAMYYALGALPIVPWDVFVADKPRYFGTPDEYGDLYRFVRTQAPLFDEYEALAAVAIIIDPNRFSVAALQPLTQMLAQRNIPYAFVLLNDAKGGRPLTKERLSGFKLLVTALLEADMPAADRAILASLDIQKLDPSAVTAARLDALRLFIAAPGGEKLRVFPRVGVGQKAGSWAFHIVDESKGGIQLGSGQGECRRRIGVRPSSLGVSDNTVATWVVGDSRRLLRGEKDAEGNVYYTIPDCPLWGILHMVKENLKTPAVPH